HPAGVLRPLTLQRALRVADLLTNPLVADGTGCLVELARGILLVAAHLVGDLLELLLKVADLRVHRVLALAECLGLGLAARARLRLLERVGVGGAFLLLVRELLGLALRALEIALTAPALVAFELLLRLAQPVERLVRLGAAVFRSIRRRTPHRVGGVLQLLHRVVQLLTLLLVPRELLELTRGL